MGAHKEDYQNASTRYDSEFNKNLQAIQLQRQLIQDNNANEDRAQAKIDKATENARATVNTVYNLITN